MAGGSITLRGVEVHNLKGVDLDLPHRTLVVLCGVSGSGKTSLALDTLYAEGQRRYIETFSAYTRQFLERLEKPAAERIEGIPPAVAVTHQHASRGNRSTVGTATEIYEYLRLLYARLAKVFCRGCGKEVRRDTPVGVMASIAALPPGLRLLVAFPYPNGDGDWSAIAARWREDGFQRAIFSGQTVSLAGEELAQAAGAMSGSPATPDASTAEGKPSAERRPTLSIVVDRLVSGSIPEARLRDSLELAFASGEGRCQVWVQEPEGVAWPNPIGSLNTLDGRPARVVSFSSAFRCEDCGIDYLPPEPRLFNFNSPLGACPACEGFGNMVDVDMDLVVPDPSKSLKDGAIAPWNTPAYAHELKELLDLAPSKHLPIDIAWRDLTAEHKRIVEEGSPEHNFGGLRGFFAWLERRKYKMHLRVYLSRWKSARTCPACHGDRLRPEALAAKLGGKSIAEVTRLPVGEAAALFRAIEIAESERAIARGPREQIVARLDFLHNVGLGYLTLDRTLKTLSGGETQRVALTAALGSSLVNMLYVLDEPSVGLHPRDVGQLLDAVIRLRTRGNTVVVVEHEEAFLRAADLLVEFGPAAGERGGQVVFQGSPADAQLPNASLTGEYLAGRRGVSVPSKRRPPQRGRLVLKGARGNNLKNITVEFPLGLLCVVSGVSGSGKSTLVQETLYPALCKRMRIEGPPALAYDDLIGEGQISDVVLVDQSPIGRSPRSCPATYLKVFDEIRGVFAETIDARTHNYTASHFSFNVEGGRCPACEGDGYTTVDMQFLADVYMKCAECEGQRYRREILAVNYRGRNIAAVLEMTAREAFSFFRGQPKVQGKLKPLLDVGLDYLRLGQPATTLSGGEAQRLKLAAYLSGAKRGRTLFLLDEPTTGLHFSDVVRLLDCFESLLDIGHSLIVVEHNLQIMKAADYLIDLGPGAGDEGGRVIGHGSPEELAKQEQSITGRYLAEALARQPPELPEEEEEEDDKEAAEE